MTKKFTEEQYQNIVKKWDGEISYIEATKAVIGYLAVEDLGYSISEQALALANSLTRELVHDKFVEKEEKFLFTKIKEVEGEVLSLNQCDKDAHIYLDFDDPTPLTIKQVEDYGYNLDAFTKTPYEHGVFTVHISEEDDLPF